MANKYKVSKHRKTNLSRTSAKNNTNTSAVIGKGKILAILIPGTLLAAGIYAASMKMKFMFVFHIYWILTALLFCLFVFLSMRNDFLFNKSARSDKQLTKLTDENFQKRTKAAKYLLLVLLPFLFTVMADAVYLLLVKDSDLFKSLAEIFFAAK